MLENLQGKKIGIVGRGVNNQKLIEYLAKHGLKFVVVQDWKKNSDLTGKLNGFDVIFRTPGLPFLAPAIAEAKKAGVEIYSQTKLFFDLCRAPIVGVTGTKGKGTTSTLIAKILEAGGHKVYLAGNIGKDPFEFLDFLHPDDLVVLELSSFQLQDLHKSPHVAVVLNITADHLDETGTYEKSAHGSLKEYFDAKIQILAHQTESDFAVLSAQLPHKAKGIGKGQKIIFDPKDVADYKFKLLGRHNLENIAAAVAVGKIFKVEERKMLKVVEEFEPLPHRLQKVLEKEGITYVDDSISTNEDSTIAAIAAFDTPIILILGGSSKGLDYLKLGAVIKRSSHIKAVVVVGQEAPKILRAIEGFEGKIFVDAKSMAEIVKYAESVAEKGDTIVLSPAAASFDMFKSYADRSEQFIKEINKS
jgi:UDP-N-acetylmuramoylalanine--D-glutamate ligase